MAMKETWVLNGKLTIYSKFHDFSIQEKQVTEFSPMKDIDGNYLFVCNEIFPIFAEKDDIMTVTYEPI